jgi:LEA14-like dessication related protein
MLATLGRTPRWLIVLLGLGLLAGCASMPSRDPLQVTVAGIEPLQGEGMEMRLLVKLRVQNPNDAALDFNGVFVNLDVQGRTFASGVTNTAGSVPGFGETVVEVPVTVSMLRMMRQVAGIMDGKPIDRITYSMSGKLNGTFGAERFTASGEFQLPRAGSASGGAL